MSLPATTKLRFHLALYAAFLGRGRRQFKQVSKEPLRSEGSFPKGLRIFFWTPDIGPGANVIVHDMLPSLQRQIAELSLDWHVSTGPQVPTHALDWLICFKAVPEAHQRSVASRTMLLICDRIELFWDRVSKFDALVGTSSRPFAQLLTTRHKDVIFIPESEPPEYLDFGKKNLSVSPAERGNVLLWHGGHYSQDALVRLRPILERWARSADAQLHVVSGQKPPREERWGTLPVHFLPWSKKQLFSSAARARLGIIPAREGLTRSWLKPASRVRCLYALGVPTLGDSRVPDAVDFMSGFGGPMARARKGWSEAIEKLWDNNGALQEIAVAGHAAVAREFSTEHTARQWIRLLSKPSAEGRESFGQIS
jgi:glycosyltransferase involved in cell wall biosynthesis